MHGTFKTFLVPVPFPLVTTFERLARRKNSCGLTLPTLRMRGMHYYYDIHTSIDIYVYLASERSERDTIRGVQIRAGVVYIY